MSAAGTANGWYSHPNSSHASSLKSPTITSPNLRDREGSDGNTLASTFTSLSLAKSPSPVQNGLHAREESAGQESQTRPAPIRSTSGGPAVAAPGAIGTGRSPPTRSALTLGFDGQTRPHHSHSISHSSTLPWPTSGPGISSNIRNNANDGNRYSQQQQNFGTHQNQSSQQRSSSHDDDLPGLSGGGVGNTEENASSSRFMQPQFNLDHAQLAKSREQRDLDDVDSGQRASATLWMGDLEGWMDETYIRRCISALGWDRDENGNQTVQTSVKMIRGASATSGYCFITFPTAAHAQSVLSHFAKQPPMLMPGSERTFKLNWATGLPGVQPKWEGEYSVFVGDLGREVTEGELVALFTPLFPSTKSAKIMYDPSTGLSRGYGFVRFADENDMHRALSLGQNTSGSGLSLRGRTLRISEASGSGGSRARTTSAETSTGGSAALLESTNGQSASAKNPRDLHIQVPGGMHGRGQTLPEDMRSPSSALYPNYGERHAGGVGVGSNSPNLLSPNATGFSIPVASPSSPTTPSYSNSPLSPSADPNNTTVFIGGLPAVIGEDTLRSFFQHFGDITYVKIPPNKGCGFVQFVRRADAELAIAKMHDFPIHGKSRIRLSWGRSQGDKQVEHVRKLAGALNVPFEAVWRMVQGQDNSTIKQIASAVGGNPGPRRADARSGPDSPLDVARLSFNPSASLGPSQQNGQLPEMHRPNNGSDFSSQRPGIYDALSGSGLDPGMQADGPGGLGGFSFRPAVPTALSPEQFGWAGPPRDNGPYSRVSPSSFAPMATSSLGGHPSLSMPLSPLPPGAGGYAQQPPAAPSPYSSYTPVHLPPPASSATNGSSASGPGGNQSAAGAPQSSSFEARQWRNHAAGFEEAF